MKHDYDLFVIGAGSGGVRAARIASLAGAKVAIAEEYRIGGTCVIRGCVPKKFRVYGAEFSQMLAHAPGYGWTVGEASFDWPTLRDNVQKEVARLSGIYTSNLAKAGVTTFEERAEIVDAHTVRLKKSGSEFTAERILVATGGRPYLPEGLPGLELGITSNEAFLLDRLPERVLIVGGGYVALEFANIFHGLGSKVRILHRSDKLLRGFDDDLRMHMHIELERGGTQLTMKTTVTKLEKDGGAIRATLSTGEKAKADVGVIRHRSRSEHARSWTRSCRLEAGRSRRGDRRRVLEELRGVHLRHRRRYQPHESHPGGDSRRPRLCQHRLQQPADAGRPCFRAERGVWPLADRHCRGDRSLTHATASSRWTSTARASVPCATCSPATRSARWMKIVVDGNSGKLLGVHIAGEDAPEMIQLAAVAVKAGLTKQQWDSTMALHPTAAEELMPMREKIAAPGSAA